MAEEPGLAGGALGPLLCGGAEPGGIGVGLKEKTMVKNRVLVPDPNSRDNKGL